MFGGVEPSGFPAIGATLDGKYRIDRLLGEGGMASVFEAQHLRLSQRVAIKLLSPEFARDPELVARFEREARAVAQLRTRHVTRVMDVDVTPDGMPYIVMEFLEGRDLEGELTARTRLPCDEAVDYVLQACAAINEAHAMGIIHRDLKPANLFLADDNGERIVKVLDFGISKIIGEATRLTGVGAVMGTVLYMPPEQVRASSNIDTRADIWSLGVILYELLTGRTPWEGTSPQIAAQIVSDDAPDVRRLAPVPDPIAAAIRTMLQRDPAQRYASVREVAAAIAPYAVPSSLGAAIAEQLVAGYSSPRMLRPSYASFSHAPAPPSSLVTMPLASSSLQPVQRPTASPKKSKSRVFVVAGALLGVLAAVGIVLAWAALRVRGTVVSTAPATAGEASASVATLATTPSAATTSEVAPPPTTTTSAEEPAASASASSTTPRSTPRPNVTPKTTPSKPTSTPASPSGAPAFL